MQFALRATDKDRDARRRQLGKFRELPARPGQCFGINKTERQIKPDNPRLGARMQVAGNNEKVDIPVSPREKIAQAFPMPDWPAEFNDFYRLAGLPFQIQGCRGAKLVNRYDHLGPRCGEAGRLRGLRLVELNGPVGPPRQSCQCFGLASVANPRRPKNPDFGAVVRMLHVLPDLWQFMCNTRFNCPGLSLVEHIGWLVTFARKLLAARARNIRQPFLRHLDLGQGRLEIVSGNITKTCLLIVLSGKSTQKARLSGYFGTCRKMAIHINV